MCKTPQLGRIHLRLQTWLPFTRHVCLSGRAWLARQLTAVGLARTTAALLIAGYHS